jgi:hypothetical protein
MAVVVEAAVEAERGSGRWMDRRQAARLIFWLSLGFVALIISQL